MLEQELVLRNVGVTEVKLNLRIIKCSKVEKHSKIHKNFFERNIIL